MKKPNLDAIRRFKEQQELKKQEETHRKIQDKLSTLEHRAAQGDRKAKTELKLIEKSKEVRDKQIDTHLTENKGTKQTINHRKNSQSTHDNGLRIKKPKKIVTNFDELMRLAATNNNQIRREEAKPSSPPPARVPSIVKKTRGSDRDITLPSVKSLPTSQSSNRSIVKVLNSDSTQKKPTRVPSQLPSNHSVQQSRSQKVIPPRVSQFNHEKQSGTIRHQNVQPQARPMPMRPPIFSGRVEMNHSRGYNHRDDYYDDDDDDDYEDEYEQDGFVVDEDDAEAQSELNKTLKSVFRYDKRRCDIREAELDRQYRQIGRVSTFEDLEREERRASRLAAIEDAEAARDEDERKRLKKLKLQGR